MTPQLFIILSGIVGLLWGAYLVRLVLRAPEGGEKQREISLAIREGARAYLRRQYITIAVVAVPLAVLLGLYIDWTSALGFLVGGTLSALAGFIGMNVAVRANVRVTEAAHH